MAIVDLLLDTAREDTLLLTKNDALGDHLEIPRTVEFLFYAETAATADTVCSFINDNCYAECRVDSSDGKYRVLAKIEMPITQNVLCSVSGLMACISKVFDIEYDGWGAAIRPEF